MKDYAKQRDERFSKLSGEALEYFTDDVQSQRPSFRELGVEGMRDLFNGKLFAAVQVLVSGNT